MTPLSGCRLVPAVADVDRIVVVSEGWLRLGVLVEGILLGEDPRHVRVDLWVILKLTQLEDVGGINHDDRLRRGLLRQLDHVLLGTRQLEVALAVLEVRVLIGVVRVAEVRVVSHLLIDIAWQVESLATADQRADGNRHRLFNRTVAPASWGLVRSVGFAAQSVRVRELEPRWLRCLHGKSLSPTASLPDRGRARGA